MEETLTVPLAVELMILRHVVRIRIILAFSPIQTSMAAYFGNLIKDLNKTLRTADINLLSIPACFIPSFRREDTANPVDKIPQFREWSTIIPELDTADFLNLYTVFMRLTA